MLGTILLIDDDPICNYLNRQILVEIQIFDKIVCLADGQEVLDYLRKAYTATPSEDAASRPELIFLDLNMPGLDGIQILEHLNKMDRESVKRVVILSSSMHPVDQQRAGSYEIFDYLVKPLTETKIRGVIDRFLQSQLHNSKNQNFMNPSVGIDRPPIERSAAEVTKKKKEQKG